MRPHRLCIAAACVLFVNASAAFAWNSTAHQVSALIAWQDLAPETKETVTKILRAHPDYVGMLIPIPATSDPASPLASAHAFDRQAFLNAATWPDLVRTPGTKSYRYNHPSWHFIDFPYDPTGAKLFPAVDVAWQPGKDPVNAVQAFQKNLADLKNENLPVPERAMALCWVEHLIGDIHQPLHAVSLYDDRFPTGDQGGNLVMVKAGQSVTNLHALWDGLLGNYQSFDAIERIAIRVTDAHLRKELAEQLRDTEFESWAKASFAQARTLAYLDGKLPLLTRDEQSKDRTKPVPEVPTGYMARAQAAAEADIALAGYRLADQLNSLFNATPSTQK